jgi:carbonic anhydrase
MSDLSETFFTSIGCMDGRVQEPVAKYGRDKFGVLYADTITEAGLVGLLSNNPSQELLESIKKKILISVQKHHSKGIIVHGHQQCAGNPVEDELHKEQVIEAARVVRDFVTEDIEVQPVFVIKKENIWSVEEI